jgi:hypothetical protein
MLTQSVSTSKECMTLVDWCWQQMQAMQHITPPASFFTPNPTSSVSQPTQQTPMLSPQEHHDHGT